MNRAELESTFKNVLKDVKKEIETNVVFDMPHRIFVQLYQENNKRFGKFHCTKCNHTWNAIENIRWENEWTCSYCKERLKLAVSNYQSRVEWANSNFSYAVEIDNGIVVVNGHIKYSLKVDDENPFDWLTETPKEEVILDSASVFIEDCGFTGVERGLNTKLRDNDFCFPKNGTNAMKDCINSLKRWLKSPIVNESSLKTSPKEWLKKIEDYEKAKKEQREKRNSKPTKAVILKEARRTYIAKDIKPPSPDISGIIFSYQTGSVGSTSKYNCYCGKCGTSFKFVINKSTPNLECPNCHMTNSKHDVCIDDCGQNYISYESTTLPENDLLIRSWNTMTEIKGLKEGTPVVKTYAAENYRVFCGKKMSLYWRSTSKDEIPQFEFESYSPGRFYGEIFQSAEEIIAEVNNSCLRYSGLSEALGLKEPTYKKICEDNGFNYIRKWYEKSSMELLVKSNLVTICRQIIGGHDIILNNFATTPYDALHISKGAFKIVGEMDLDIEQAKYVNMLWEVEPNITAEKFREILDTKININLMVQMCKEYELKIQDVLKYVQSAYSHQCIDKPEALRIWNDYLRMAKKIKIDLTDKNRMYPTSLKKEHDIAVFAYKEVRLEADRKQFTSQAEKNVEKYGNYSDKNFLIVIPMCLEDVVNEASQQKNCLRSYIEQIKNGDTTVCFIRRKSNPDKSYVTVEVYNNEIVQIKGYCNSDPKDKELFDFITKWASKKSIGIGR